MKTVTIDCAAIADKAALHKALSEALDFPDWYGHNLDALYDCLTEIDPDTTLRLLNWSAVGGWAQGFEAVFADAQQDNPCFHVEF